MGWPEYLMIAEHSVAGRLAGGGDAECATAGKAKCYEDL